MGRAPLGEILPDGGVLVPNPEDYVRIPPGSMVARDGRYVFQLTEELRILGPTVRAFSSARGRR